VVVSTRRDLLLLLRKQPGITVTELARELRLTGMGVRRHLDALTREGVVVPTERARKGVGRPAAGWRLTGAGLELFPRRYDRLALELLEDLAEVGGPDAVEALFAHHTDKVVARCETVLDGADLPDRLATIARLRDDEGYEAGFGEDGDGSLVFTEANCAVHNVAEQCPAVCAHEHDLLRRLLGPDVEVTRTSHILAGDATCTYRVSRAAKTPAAPA
jgi:predicted ArsR family transcriptional regulator